MYECRFSITKWIHIHLGDGGLRLFFARIANALRPGGIFVLERQDWKSYDQARSLGAVRIAYPISHLAYRISHPLPITKNGLIDVKFLIRKRNE